MCKWSSSVLFSGVDVCCSPRPVAPVSVPDRREDWQNVSSCFQISGSSCDVSPGISDFDVYNYIRLGLGRSPDDTWSMSVTCDPLKDPTRRFSPPSFSMFLDGRRLRVEVAFPCAPAPVCWDESPTRCCSVTDFMELNTTVWLYNKNNASDAQTRSNLVQKGRSFSVEFVWLSAGQEYCVVVSLASSPLSSPQCVSVPALENLNLFILGLCGMLMSSLLIAVCGFWIWWGSSDNTLPKPLWSLQSVNQEDQFEDGLRLASQEEEVFVVDHLSIISFPSLDGSEPFSDRAPSLSLGAGYYATPVLQHHIYPGHCDYPGDLEADGCLSPAGGPESTRLWEPALLGLPGIPLSSVRLAGAQGEDVDLHHLAGLLLTGEQDTQAPAAEDQGAQNMSSDIKVQALGLS
ncbi:uncharacterized protein LOC143475003 isoform X2 [Brachyhypopomus gauderio]|uniref:uncharacterized protein LOC143475003 isoform X2 n=1 Tax=Brachyhypopomus gauderio TaxID=698409 RepID=UPI004042B0E4